MLFLYHFTPFQIHSASSKYIQETAIPFMLSVIKKYIFFIVLHFPKNGDLCLQNEKLHEE